jgi:hypothetical protein
MAKKVLYSKQVFVDEAIAVATVDSLIVNIPFLDNISIEIAWTGTPTGTFQVLGSVSGVNYNPVAIGIKAAAGVPDTTLVSFQNQGYQFLKLRYIGTGGNGTLNAWVGGKEI